MIRIENIESKKDKQKVRRLNFIISQLSSYLPIEQVKKWEEDTSYTSFRSKLESLKEMHEIFDYFDIKDQYRYAFFAKVKYQQKARHSEYLVKPILIKKDNKDYTHGSGGSWRNVIRYPRKKRKTAWKRFYKLFPRLKPKNYV